MGRVSKKEFAKYIKEHRTMLGYTQQELAMILGVSSEVVSKWERGIRFPDFEMITPLAEALGVTVQELMDGSKSTGEEINRIAIFSTVGAIAIALIATTIMIITGKGPKFTGNKSQMETSTVYDEDKVETVPAGPGFASEYFGIYECKDAQVGENAYIIMCVDGKLDAYILGNSPSQVLFEIRNIIDNTIITSTDEHIYIAGVGKIKYKERVYEFVTKDFSMALGMAIVTDKGLLVDIDRQGLTIITNYDKLCPATIKTGDVVSLYISPIRDSYPGQAECYGMCKGGKNRDYNKWADIEELGYSILYSEDDDEEEYDTEHAIIFDPASGLYNDQNEQLLDFSELVVYGKITYDLDHHVLVKVKSELEGRFVIDPHVEYIDDYSFKDCVNLREIVIPEQVTGIGEMAFAGCTSLSKIAVYRDSYAHRYFKEHPIYGVEMCVLDLIID